jgi:hypothetical protein
MKTFIILKALLLWAYVVTAQTAKTSTVRIKKVENINGVEKVWDTTYTTDGTGVMHIKSDELKMGELPLKEGEKFHTMFVTGDCEGKGGEHTFKFTYNDSTMNHQVHRVIKTSGEMTEEEKKAFREALKAREDAFPGGARTGDNVVIMERGQGQAAGNRKFIMIRTVRVSEASREESSRLKGATVAEQDLSLENISCYPNPATGRFNLSFDVPGKGDVTVEVYSMEGSKVLSETVKEMSGRFSREIDLSDEAKGVYFVRVTQGGGSTVKKLIVE